MLLAYTGTNYGGFQINSGQRTLQVELELALYNSHLVTSRNFGFPNKYSWSTSG
jgi:tRNA U38,U39,U40 pseudouridine synthase TruA